MIVGGLPAETREPQARIFRPIGCGWTSEGLFRTWRVQLQPFNQGATTRNCYLPYVTHRMLLPGGLWLGRPILGQQNRFFNKWLFTP